MQPLNTGQYKNHLDIVFIVICGGYFLTEKNLIKETPSSELMIDLGKKNTIPQVAFQDLQNIRQLENLFRAYTLIAIISGRSSPYHQQHCLMAYACIIRIWQVRR